MLSWASAKGFSGSVMAKKWKANSNAKWDDRSLFQRFRWPLLALVVIGGLASLAWYRYTVSDYKYGDNGSVEEKAMSKCIQDNTRHDANDDTTADAATACVHQDEVPVGKGQGF
jgi:hypothetical protein